LNKADFRKHVSRIIDINDSEWEYFRSLFGSRKVKRKEFLLRAGEVCIHEYFVISGCLRTYNIDTNGFEHVLMFSVENWWAGDMHSFLSGEPAFFNVDALEDTEVLQINNPDLERLYKKIPKFERYFRILIQNSFVNHQKRVIQNMSLSAEERYLIFVSKYPKLEQRIAQKQIASYLGITPEFLSHIRRKIAKK